MPTYQTMGIAGFYVALATGVAGGMVRGLSLLIIAGVAVVSGLSFFLWAWLRKVVTGHETIVLLEHVWFAFAVVAALLFALGEPLLPYLDVFAVSLCPFLAMGRVGCLLTGCCHGRPSRMGITYGEEAARDGFPRHLVGVRLFPVPALEFLGLLVIGVAGLVVLPFARPGGVLVWFLVAYAILRFGLEGLRGDRRPEFLSLSVPRWMCLVQFWFALALWESMLQAGLPRAHLVLLAGALLVLLVTGVRLRRAWDPRRALLAGGHLRELAELIRNAAADAEGKAGPAVAATGLGVVTGVSWARADQADRLHVSLSLGERDSNLALLCELAARVLPGLEPQSARWSENGVLHVLAPDPGGECAPSESESERVSRVLFGTLIRQAQGEGPSQAVPPTPAPEADRGATGYFNPAPGSVRLAEVRESHGPGPGLR